MTASVLQSAQATDNGVTGTTLAVTLTGVTAGSTIHIFAGDGIDSASTISVADPTNGSYGATFDDVQDPANARVLQCRKENVAHVAGALVITATWSVTQSFKALWAVEVGGVVTTGSALDGHTGQNQQTPTTGTDATSSGNATNSAQPALMVALCFDIAGNNTVAAGTGFTDNGAGWLYGAGGNQARLESKRITTTSPVAATFTAAANESHSTLLAIYDEIGAGAGPVTDQVPLDGAIVTPKTTNSRSIFRPETVLPIGALIHSLSSIAWANPTPVPQRAQIFKQVLQPVQPTGTGKFALPKNANLYTSPQLGPPSYVPKRVDVAQPVGTGKFALPKAGYGLYVDLPIDTPLISKRVESIEPIGSRITGALTSIGWFVPDAARPRAQPSSVIVAVVENDFSSAPALYPWFDGYLETRKQTPQSRQPDVANPVNAGAFSTLTSVGWISYEARTAALVSTRLQPVGAESPLKPFLSPSTGFFGADSKAPVVPPPKAQDPQQPVGPLVPFVSASSGFQTVDTRAPKLAPPRPEASQPTGPLSPFVSKTLGWLNPESRNPIVPAPRAQDAQQPVSALNPFVSTTLGWLTVDLPFSSALISKRTFESQPVGYLLTPQPFGWNAGYDQARTVTVSRRVDVSAPVGTAFAIALPSNGWLATDNPRTPLALGKSVPQDPVGNLLVLPPLPSFGWFQTDNPRTPYSSTRSVTVDPVGNKFFVPPPLGPYWYAEQSPRSTFAPRGVATSEPIGTRFAALTSIGWLSPTDSPRGVVTGMRVQPVDPLNALRFGGTPWATVEIVTVRGKPARAQEISQPTSPLVPFVSVSTGWQVQEQSRTRTQVKYPESSAPIGNLGAPLASIGWVTSDPRRAQTAKATPQDPFNPFQQLVLVPLVSLGWQTVDYKYQKPVSIRPLPSEPVGTLITALPFEQSGVTRQSVAFACDETTRYSVIVNTGVQQRYSVIFSEN